MRAPTTACPASGYATSSFCAADRVAVPPFFSSPTMTRSTAPSISSQPTVDLAIRAAEIAASFIRFSSWAPLNPGVRRAIASRSTSGSSGLPRECTPRIRARPLKSGRATLIFQIDIGFKWFTTRVYAKNTCASLEVRESNVDLSDRHRVQVVYHESVRQEYVRVP